MNDGVLVVMVHGLWPKGRYVLWCARVYLKQALNRELQPSVSFDPLRNLRKPISHIHSTIDTRDSAITSTDALNCDVSNAS